LPNGTLLKLGGRTDQGFTGKALVTDPRDNQSILVPASLTLARAWHSATLLPDGTVFVYGGIDAAGNVLSGGELFDPDSDTFTLLTSVGLTLGTEEP